MKKQRKRPKYFKARFDKEWTVVEEDDRSMSMREA